MSDYQNYQTESAVAAALAADSSLLSYEIIKPQTALVNPQARVLDLEQYSGGRNRKRGTFTTEDFHSFGEYVRSAINPEEVRVFVSKDAMQAIAILNFDAADYEQGHLDHKAILEAEETVVFNKLLGMHNYGRVGQKPFAEFLEDWGHRVVARDSEGNEIENAKAVSAIRNMRIAESAQTDSTAGNYRESRSRLESVEAKSIDGALPAYFTVTDECYRDMNARKLKLRLGISSRDGEPNFKLEIIGLQLIRDELAKEFAEHVENGLGDDFVVVIGQFKG